MSYQFCCMVQALGKSPNSITTKLQVSANRCLKSIFNIYWPNTVSNVNLLKMADMQQKDVIIKRHKRGWKDTRRKDEFSVARQLI